MAIGTIRFPSSKGKTPLRGSEVQRQQELAQYEREKNKEAQRSVIFNPQRNSLLQRGTRLQPVRTLREGTRASEVGPTNQEQGQKELERTEDIQLALHDLQQPILDPNRFGMGTARALSAIGSVLGSVASLGENLYAKKNEEEMVEAKRLEKVALELEEKRNKDESFNVNLSLIKFRSGQKTAVTTLMQRAMETGEFSGFTEQVNEFLDDEIKNYLETVPEAHQAEVELKLTQDQASYNKSTLGFEYDKILEKQNSEVVSYLDDLIKGIQDGDTTAGAAITDAASLMETSSISAVDRADILQVFKDRAILEEFITESSNTWAKGSNLLPADGKDVVVSGMSSSSRGLLNAIAKVESGGNYNKLHGGGTFTDFSRHPGYQRDFNGNLKRKNYKGKQVKISAAGRYQFIHPTWMKLKEELGLPDFSPASQDFAAERYFNQIYEREGKYDMTVAEALSDDNPLYALDVKRVLAEGHWVGLQDMNDEDFLDVIAENITKGPTGTETTPIMFEELTASQSRDINQRIAARTAENRKVEDEQKAAAYTAWKDNDYDRSVRGEQTPQEVEDNIDLFDNTPDFRKSHDAAKKAHKNTILSAKLTDSLEDDTHIWLGQDQEVVDSAATQELLTKFVQNDYKEFDKFRETVIEKTGLIPELVVEVLEKKINSPNEEDRLFAFTSLSEVYENDSSIVDNALSEKSSKKIALFTSQKDSHPPKDILAALYMTLDVTDIIDVGKRIKEVNNLMINPTDTPPTYDEERVTKLFTNFFEFSAEAPEHSVPRKNLEKDYNDFLTTGYIAFTNEDSAIDYADQEIQKVYSVMYNTKGDKYIMKYAPTKVVPMVGESHYWVEAKTRSDLKALGIKNWATADFVYLADEQTEKEFKQYKGKPKDKIPSYLLQVHTGQDENVEGGYELILTKKGLPERFSYSLTPDIKEENSNRQEIHMLVGSNKLLEDIIFGINSTANFANRLKTDAEMLVVQETQNEIDDNNVSIEDIREKLTNFIYPKSVLKQILPGRKQAGGMTE